MISRICIITILLLCAEVSAQTPDPYLVSKVMAEGPVRDRAYAEAVVAAAEETATPDVPVELLLAQAWIESRFVPEATSRLIDGKRQTGVWKSLKPPKGATGNFYCGITQSVAPTWKRCLELRDPKVAMVAGIAGMEYWLKRGKTLRRALQGYGCGNIGMDGACKSYANRVMSRMRVFQRPATNTKPSS
jgi:hypothetical protein